MNGLINLNFSKVQNVYGGMIKKPFDIKGVLLGKEKNTVRVDVGNNRIAEAVLKDRIDQRIGDKVSIDKSQIVSMRIYDRLQDDKSMEQDQYEEMLKSYGIDLTKQSLDAVKALEKFNMPPSKESIESLMVSNRYLDIIQQELNYDMAIKLMKKDVDVEHDSLQKVADAIEEIRKEEESVSPWRLFSDKEMTTEEAEKIAKNIYGSSMGKDITDIIKALHKAKADINKKSIERVHDIFYKLWKLDDMQDEEFVGIYKEGIEPTIEKLYNVKYSVKEGIIPAELDVSRLAARAYDEHVTQPIKIRNKDLELMKEKIIVRLKEMNIEPTKENINLAKNLLKAGISLTKENINEILKMKEALKSLKNELDIEKACKMLKDGLDIQKKDIREVADILKIFYKQDQETENRMMDRKEIEKLLKQDQPIDFLEKLKNMPEKINVKGFNRIVNINQVFNKVKTLNFHQISFHLSKNIPFTIKQISKIHDQLHPLEIKNTNSKMLPLEEEKIKNYMIDNEERLGLKEIPQGLTKAFDAGKALVTNGLQLSILNVQRVFEVYGQYSRIRKNLSPQMVIDSIEENKDLENIELKELDAYIQEKMEDADKNENTKAYKDAKRMNPMQKLVNNISIMGKEGNTLLPLLLKNNMLFSLKEIESLSLFLKNQDQLGTKIDEMLQLLGEVNHPELRKKLLELERLSKRVSHKLKAGELEEEKSYNELIVHIENMERDMNFSDEGKEQFKEHMQEMMDSLKIQKKLKALQLPVLMGDQFKNLQVFVQENNIFKKEVDGKPLTAFLNLDTNNIGQINMSLNIDKNQVDLMIGVNEDEGEEKLKKYIPSLEKMLEEIGYSLGKISFDTVDENQNMSQRIHENKGKTRALFDLKI